MAVEQFAAAPPRRNVGVYAGLFFVALSWGALFLRILAGNLGSFDSVLDWVYAGSVCGGVLASLFGVAAIRWRGEGPLAFVVLLISLLLPMLYVIFFGLLWIMLGGAGGGAGD